MSNKRSNLVPPLPNTVMATVENIMKVVPCSEYEAFEALKDSVMDPNEAVMLLLERGAFQEVKSRKQKEKKVPNRSSNDATESCSQFPGGAPTRTRGREFGIHESISFPQARTFQAAKYKLMIQDVPKNPIKAAAESSSRCPSSTSTLASHMPQPLRTQKNCSFLLKPPSEDVRVDNLFQCFHCPAFNPFTFKRDLKDHNRKDHFYWKEECLVCNNVFPSEKKLSEHQEAYSHGFRVTKKQYQCIHCCESKTYNSIKDLDIHTRMHGRFKYRCKFCKNKLETRHAVSVHKPGCLLANRPKAADESDSSEELDDEEREEGDWSSDESDM